MVDDQPGETAVAVRERMDHDQPLVDLCQRGRNITGLRVGQHGVQMGVEIPTKLFHQRRHPAGRGEILTVAARQVHVVRAILVFAGVTR